MVTCHVLAGGAHGALLWWWVGFAHPNDASGTLVELLLFCINLLWELKRFVLKLQSVKKTQPKQSKISK